MKPLKLSIQAFGPFSGVEEIDFSVLGDSPLFLINGPTGAGKSSILDAICFALYGKTTTDEREASAMRCDQSPAEIQTEITLDFSLAGKQYRVKRVPQQERPKARGEGTTIENGYATLWEVTDTNELTLIVAKKIKEVTQEIETITGLNVEQFRQVMVLPQGKFRELLLADSKDREKIFGQLFQTQIYKRIEDDLKQQAASIYDEVRDLENQIKGILQSAEVNSEDEIQQLLETSKPDLQKATKQKALAQQLLHDALRNKEVALALIKQFDELSTTKDKLSTLTLQQQNIEQKQKQLDRAIKAEKIKPIFDETVRIATERSKLEKEITRHKVSQVQAKQAIVQAKAELERALKSFQDVEPLKQQQLLLNQYQQKISKLVDAKKAYTIAEESRQTSVVNVNKLQQQFVDNAQQTEAIEKKISAVQQSVIVLGNKQVQLAELSRQNTLRHKLEKTQATYKAHSNELEAAKLQFEDTSRASTTSHEKALKQEMLWHSAQAIALAKELQQNQPCPVCGSTQHPSPALPDNKLGVVSKEDVELARSQADENKTLQQNAAMQLNTLEVESQQFTQQLTELKQTLGKLSESTVEQVEHLFNSLQGEVTQLEQQQGELDQLNTKLLEHKSTAENIALELNEAQRSDDQLNNQLIKEQAAVSHLASEIPQQYQSQPVLSEAIEKVSELINQLSDSLETSRGKAKSCDIKYAQVNATVNSLTTTLTQLNEKNTRASQAWKQTLEESAFAAFEDYQLSILIEVEQLSLSTEISKYTHQLKELEGALKQQNKELVNKSVPDLASVNEVCTEMENKYQIADREWHELDSTVKQLKSVQKKLSKAHDENKELEASYAIVGTLSDVANGRHYNKLSLQRFVLSVLLDDVLIQASQRLLLMSKGRYQMFRKDARSKGNKASGLELDVEDAYTGKSRSVATLSGGESFMAALALALGLSDVVQAYAGGIKLDTLFIDEGFGSLDQESLDLAIRTLLDLQASGRMIGIISHVSELKEQMALRLDVISTKTGSHVKMISL